MIKILDNYYELDLISIIYELKQQLSYKSLFNQIKDLPEDIMVTCPFHKGGQERKASCGIRKADGWVHCFTCGESCSLQQMISRCFGYNDYGQYGIQWLKNNFLGEISDKRNIHIDIDRISPKKEASKFVSEEELDKYRYWHPYMKTRKLTDEVIDLFDVGYDVNTDCLTFPVKDENGNCLFVARRSVKTKFFSYPSGVDKPIYGLYEIKKVFPNTQEVIICESMINCLTCYCYGKPALALNGTGSDSQLEELCKLPYRRIILALDPDDAGNKGSMRIMKKLRGKKMVSRLLIPVGKDVNDLSKEEFDNLDEVFF